MNLWKYSDGSIPLNLSKEIWMVNFTKKYSTIVNKIDNYDISILDDNFYYNGQLCLPYTEYLNTDYYYYFYTKGEADFYANYLQISVSKAILKQGSQFDYGALIPIHQMRLRDSEEYIKPLIPKYAYMMV